jgi:phage virion morphogenesis protein
MADQIQIEIDDRALLAALANAIAASVDLTPLMQDIAGVLEDASERAFINQADPATGAPWAPLSETTKKRRKRGPPFAILQDNGDLAGSLGSSHTSDEAVVGVAEKYGVTHQFGAKRGQYGFAAGAYTFDGDEIRPRAIPIPWGDIPARPFLGIGPTDEKEILALVSGYISSSFSG